jgi:hypothetical protein
MRPNPLDAKQPEYGDAVAVLVGKMDPLHMDYCRAAEGLLSRSDVKHVWVCPLSSSPEADVHVRNMTTIFCSDFSLNKRQISCCTVALDKKIGDAAAIASWLRSKFPFLKFTLATLASEPARDQQPTIAIRLGVAASETPAGASLMLLPQYMPSPTDLKTRIGSGLNEERHFIAPIWGYVQSKRLYREN